MNELVIFGFGLFCGVVSTLSGVLICQVFQKQKQDNQRTNDLVEQSSKPKAHYIGKEIE